MVAVLERPVLGSMVPRVRWVPSYVRSLGGEAIELAAAAGLVLDEHQTLVLDAALGLREDGKFAAFEVGVVEPRQNGKGGILEARELAGVELLNEELLIHSAHEYATTLEAFYRMQVLVETAGLKVRKMRSAHSEQGFDFMNGCRLRYRTRTRGGGRGFSCDFLALDEAMFLAEFAHAALVPTMSARPNPQVFYTGSAVDQETHEHGVVLARVRERGLAGDAKQMAYFEWSLDLDHPDEVTEEIATDELAWAEANPALGVRIAAEHVAAEQRALSARNFAVERLGVGDWPAVDGSASAPIGVEQWKALTDLRSSALDPVTFAFDISPDRSSASIAVAGRRADGLAHVEIVEHQRTTSWVVARLAELMKHQPAAVLCDATGPAASLLNELAQSGVQVETVSAAEHAQACGQIFDLVAQERLRHLGTPELVAAIKGASTRPLGDAWAWSRKSSSVDISPLVAGTLALWGSGVPVEAATGWAAV